MKKRILTLALTLCLALPVTAIAAPKEWATRGDMATLLATASGEAYEDYQQPAFPDADSTAVNWAYAKWVVNGDDEGNFRPDDVLTREQAATMLGRFLDYRYSALPAGCGTGAPRMDNIAPWAEDGVMKCWMYGIIDTDDKPDFRPQQAVSGIEAETWVKRACSLTMSAIAAPEQPAFADALVSAAGPQGNFTLSPYSARLCLAMLANGARGETQKELLSALQIEDLTAFNAAVKKQLQTYDGYARIMSLETANSIWLNQSRYDGKGAFLLPFEKSMQDSFRAEARTVTDRNSVEQVNAWVKEKTHGKIPSILTEQKRKFAAALINAVYFKAAWENEFPKQWTDKQAFTNADGTQTMTDFMHQTDYFGYYSTPGAEALQMDYRNDAVDNEQGDNWQRFDEADFSMYLIKADETLAVQHFLDNAAFERGTVRVSVPKFKVEYGAPLDDALRALGVKTAYDMQQADLSAMLAPTPEGKPFLDTVLQKTYLAIDEKGTEAAAVTAAVVDAGSAPERPPLVREFRADSPFWFAIRDNANGEILFVGRYETAN